jgi:hypothetical protein
VAAGAHNTTPVEAQRRVPGSVTSTKAPQHKMPVSGAGPLTMTARTPTHAVTGPATLDGTHTAIETPARTPPLTGATAADVHPCAMNS